MSLPVVAIIGRPNVGKSTLVNRLAGARDAIVYDQPGVTRDRTYQPAFWGDRDYMVVDTGGLVFDDDTEFLPYIREQARLALVEASAAVLVVDGQEGPTEADATLPSGCGSNRCLCFLAVNKCESPDQGPDSSGAVLGIGVGGALSGFWHSR
jgi:GTP-binding protein